MINKWERVSRAVGDNVTEITYRNETYPGARIVSCKHKVENHSPRGFWEYTNFIVKRGPLQSREFWRMKDAKEFAEKGCPDYENHH